MKHEVPPVSVSPAPKPPMEEDTFSSPPLPSSSTLLVHVDAAPTPAAQPREHIPAQGNPQVVRLLPPGAVLMDKRGVVARAPIRSEPSLPSPLHLMQTEWTQERQAAKAEIDRLSQVRVCFMYQCALSWAFC